MILITDTDKTRRDTVAEMFYYMGILAHAVRPDAVESEIGNGYSALLFTAPDHTPNAEEIADKARKSGLITVVAIREGESDVYDLTFPKGTYSAAIATAITRHRTELGLSALGRYECMGLDASCDKPVPTYLGEPLSLTRTEAMILRYLIHSYPRSVTPKEVLTYAFRGSRAPEPSSVRTHISIMNKKLRATLGCTLTEQSGKGGYVLAMQREAITV